MTGTRPPFAPSVKRQMPKQWQVMALAQRLWEQHGHAGQHCEPGSTGIGSCAFVDERQSPLTAPTEPGSAA